MSGSTENTIAISSTTRTLLKLPRISLRVFSTQEIEQHFNNPNRENISPKENTKKRKLEAEETFSEIFEETAPIIKKQRTKKLQFTKESIIGFDLDETLFTCDTSTIQNKPHTNLKPYEYSFQFSDEITGLAGNYVIIKLLHPEKSIPLLQHVAANHRLAIITAGFYPKEWIKLILEKIGITTDFIYANRNIATDLKFLKYIEKLPELYLPFIPDEFYQTKTTQKPAVIQYLRSTMTNGDSDHASAALLDDCANQFLDYAQRLNNNGFPPIHIEPATSPFGDHFDSFANLINFTLPQTEINQQLITSKQFRN